MRALRHLAAVALLAAGCTSSSSPAGSTTSSSPPASAPTTSVTSTTTTTSAPVEPSVCLAGETEFVTEGLVATLGEEAGDAAAIGSIRWEGHAGCERLVIDLLTAAGAPALRLGEASVGFRAELGVVRVEVPVRTTAVADSTIESDIVDRVYVVRTDDGDLAVDIHLATDDAVAVRSLELDAPTRVVVDLAPSDAGMGRIAAPRVTPSLVLLSPLGGPAEYPLEVMGYARTFEANVVAELSQQGEIVASTFTTAADWTEAWGEFAIIVDSGPAGESSLFVGEYDARDGSPAGAFIQLDMS